MAIPEQVRKQSEAVQQLYKELNGDQTESETTVEDAAPETPEVDEADSGYGTATPSAPEEQGKADTQDEKTVEQKYKTLQGMYNAEVPRLHAERRELASRVSQLEQLLASMSNQSAKQIAATPTAKLVTDKDVEEYGESIDVMRRVSREEASAAQQRIAQLEGMVRQLQASVVPKVEQISQRQAQNSEQAFWMELSNAVPNWQDTNDNSNFQSWLLDVDPLTGISRQTYLEDAQRNLDVRRVASFFKAWDELNGKSVAQTNRRASASQLERQVAPGRGRSGGNSTATDSKTYTPEDIKKFFHEVRMGKFKGREQERGRIERDIFAAQREGRIVTA
jgi:hypothetical protein